MGEDVIDLAQGEPYAQRRRDCKCGEEQQRE
jgi:hypothetical protein